MTRSSSALSAGLLAALLAAAPASAQPPGTSTADAARALYVEGKDLRRTGDLQASLEKLEAAHALYATPITALEVARGRALVGRLRAAIEVLESIDRLPEKAGESSKAAGARAEARALLEQYRARLAKLVLRVEGQGAGVRVQVDAELVPESALGGPWLVDPGAHHAEAARGDAHAAEDVRVGEGEERVITLRLVAPAPPPVVVPPPVAASVVVLPPVLPPPVLPVVVPAPPPVAPPEHRTSPIAYVGFGVAALGVGVGTVTGVLTLVRASTLRRECQSGACPPAAGLDATQTMGNVSTAAFIVGGVGLGVGVVALLLGGDKAPEPKGAWVKPWIGGPAAGLRGAF